MDYLERRKTITLEEFNALDNQLKAKTCKHLLLVDDKGEIDYDNMGKFLEEIAPKEMYVEEDGVVKKKKTTAKKFASEKIKALKELHEENTNKALNNRLRKAERKEMGNFVPDKKIR